MSCQINGNNPNINFLALYLIYKLILTVLHEGYMHKDFLPTFMVTHTLKPLE